MSTTLTFVDATDQLPRCRTLIVVGRRARLLADDVLAQLPEGVSPQAWRSMVGRGKVGEDGRAASTWLEGPPVRVIAGILPDACSRHNTPSRAWAVPGLVRTAKTSEKANIVIAPDDPHHAYALATSVARALPTYDARSTAPKERSVHVAVLVGPEGTPPPLDRIRAAAHGIRRAAHLVDMPPAELDTRRFLAEARDVAARHDGVSLTTVVGEALRDQGFGGLWGVGKAASSPPALVVLDHAPEGAVEHDAWIGKGIVYDTGGLSIKSKTGMPGMKTDMGGAAAVLGAFEAAVRLQPTRRITAILCIAENAVGPDATRPDDVLRMYSGRTVEVNNTDAEGRLVLADGLAWALRHREPTRLIDLATLTGAQATATGKRHAAVYTNDADLEAQAFEAGLASADLVYPLPFVPEFFRREFSSTIADLRNSVKNRRNAQSSCAGEFLHAHLGGSDTPWLHVDMAAPSTEGGRGTGFGVRLLLTLADLGA